MKREILYLFDNKKEKKYGLNLGIKVNNRNIPEFDVYDINGKKIGTLHLIRPEPKNIEDLVEVENEQCNINKISKNTKERIIKAVNDTYITKYGNVYTYWYHLKKLWSNYNNEFGGRIYKEVRDYYKSYNYSATIYLLYTKENLEKYGINISVKTTDRGFPHINILNKNNKKIGMIYLTNLIPKTIDDIIDYNGGKKYKKLSKNIKEKILKLISLLFNENKPQWSRLCDLWEDFHNKWDAKQCDIEKVENRIEDYYK